MIILTGASQGIGAFLLDTLIKCTNEDIVGIYHRTLPSQHSHLYYKMDVTCEEEIIEFVRIYTPRLKNIKLVHCAGINTNAWLQKTTLDMWRQVYQANLESAFLLTKHLITPMREDLFGRIVFCSSIVPQVGVPGTAAYASSKAGLWGLMKAVAIENATKNITCNTLNLGYFNLGMIKQVPDKHLEKIVESIPMKRLGGGESIYNAVKFMFESDYLTGAQIDLNGGLF